MEISVASTWLVNLALQQIVLQLKFFFIGGPRYYFTVTVSMKKVSI